MYERNYHSKVLKNDGVEKKKKSFSWNTFFWVFGILIFVSGIVYCIKAPQFQIKNIYVNGAVVADQEEIVNLAKDELDGDFISFFPKSSILLANTKKISKKIHNNFPRFKSVEVERSTLDSLSINITEYEGKYLWCDEGCSFMSDDAVVFAPAPYFSGDAYLKIFIRERLEYPFTPITHDELSMVSEISSKLRDIDIDLTEFHFVSEQKLDLKFLHNTNIAHIYFDPTRDIDSAMDALYTGIKTDPLASMYRNSKKVLEYIDLRFSDKVVYKFQD